MLKNQSFQESTLNNPLLSSETSKIISTEKTIYQSNSFLSKLFFIWSYNAIKLNYKSDEVYKYKPSLSKKQNDAFHDNFPLNKTSHYPLSLFLAIIKTNLYDIGLVLLLAIMAVILQSIQFFSLRKLMEQFSSDKTSDNTSSYMYIYFYGSLFLISRFNYAGTMQHKIFKDNLLNITLGNQLISILHSKIIQLKNISETSEGEIVNLIQSDCDGITLIFSYGASSVVVPFQIILYFFLLYEYYGFIVLCLLFATLGVALVIGYVIQIFYYADQDFYMKAMDIRYKETDETLGRIKEIKLNGYEDYFNDRILKTRKNELYFFNNILDQGIVNNYVFFTMPITLSLIAFGYVSYTQISFDLPNILTSILIFNSLAYPLYRFPVFITGVAQAWVSLRRLCNFFNSTPLQQKSIMIDYDNKEKSSICLLGGIASGKTTLINSLMSSLLKDKETISYSEQDFYIMNKSIQENIIFFSEFNKEKYDKVIEACELTIDIQQMQKGSETICGNNGDKLSGGQKARISLARALYNEKSDLIIIDDAFAGLDGRVASSVFDKAIQEALKDKSKIMSFSHIGFLNDNQMKLFTRFIYLEECKVIFDGSYDEFIKTKYYTRIITNDKEQMKIMVDNITNTTDISVIEKETENDEKLKQKQLNKESIINKAINNTKDQEKFYEKISLWQSMKLIGIWNIAGLIIFPILYESFEILRIFSISSNPVNLIIDTSNTSVIMENQRLKYLDYAMISLCSSLFLLLREATIYKATYSINKTLHNTMITKLLQAPINLFHDIIPKSKIMNRLSKDINSLRYTLKFFVHALKSFFLLFPTIIICTYYSYLSLLCLPIMIIGIYYPMKIYLPKGVEINTIETEARSPILGIYTHTLSGVKTINAFNCIKEIKEELNNQLDYLLSASLIKNGAYGWYSLTIELFSNCYIMIIMIYCVFFGNSSQLTPRSIGFLLTYSISLIETLFGVMDNIVNFQKSKIHYDRCYEYTVIPQEKSIIHQSNKDQVEIYQDKKTIDYSSIITFDNFTVKYRPNLEDVLKGITCSIMPNSKVAIIGRTGSGKSSVLLSLLRIIEGYQGKINISNCDLATIPLNELRKNISIVPQSPFIFEGTLKENIDPLNKYDKDTLLHEISQMPFMTDLINKYSINEFITKQNNISIGEKQLICLCRALLNKRSILMLDEATSNLDPETEKIIYNTINLLCNNMTVIAIVHKLSYLNIFDQIIVLNNGTLVETGSFQDLSLNSESHFSRIFLNQ